MSIEQRETDAYREGEAACRLGYLKSICSLGPGARREAWMQGWTAEFRRRNGIDPASEVDKS